MSEGVSIVGYVCERLPRCRVFMFKDITHCPACGRPLSEHRTFELKPP